jgi:hypothetical protein
MRPLSALLCGLALTVATGAAKEPTFKFVDIQPKANHALKEDMGADYEGNNLGNLPQGEQKLEDTPFKIGEKMIRLKGNNDETLPEKVEDIKVDAKFEKLHILHSTEYRVGEDADDKEIGAYVVHYADKTEERIPIVYNEDLQDWWGYPGSPEVTRAKVAWTGNNTAADNFGDDIKIRLFDLTWTNPHPEKEVATIDFTSKETMCKPFLVALTLENN